jgi:hypothetical protein
MLNEPHMLMEFKLTQNYVPTRTVTTTTDAVTLHDILEEFEMFLRGCGFFIDGKLDIVPDDTEFPDTSL